MAQLRYGPSPRSKVSEIAALHLSQKAGRNAPSIVFQNHINMYPSIRNVGIVILERGGRRTAPAGGRYVGARRYRGGAVASGAKFIGGITRVVTRTMSERIAIAGIVRRRRILPGGDAPDAGNVVGGVGVKVRVSNGKSSICYIAAGKRPRSGPTATRPHSDGAFIEYEGPRAAPCEF